MLGVRSYYVERNYVGGESWKLSFRVNFIGLIWIVTLPYIWQVFLLNERYCKIYYAYFQLQIWRHDFWKRKQGWRSGESTRLPSTWPGFDSPTRRYMWVEFVIDSRPCSESKSSPSLNKVDWLIDWLIDLSSSISLNNHRGRLFVRLRFWFVQLFLRLPSSSCYPWA